MKKRHSIYGKPLVSLFLFFILLSSAQVVKGQIIVWKGGYSENWKTAENWDSGLVPTDNDNVNIPGGTTYQPEISSPAICNNLTIESEGILTISNSSLISNGLITINVNGTYHSENSDCNLNNIDNYGIFNAGSGKTTILGSFFNTGTFNHNDGTIEYIGSVQEIAGVNYSSLTLLAGTYTIVSAITVDDLLWVCEGATWSNTNNSNVTLNEINNEGIFNAGSGTTSIKGGFTNTGTFNHNSGTVNYNGLDQDVANINYYNLSLSGMYVTKIVSSDITVTNHLDNGGSQENTTTLDMAGYTLSASSIDNTFAKIRFSSNSNVQVIPTGTVDYYGSANSVKTGTYETLNLSVSGSVVIAENVAVTCDNLGVSSGTTLLVRSTSESATGSLIVNTSVSNSGTIKAERFMSNDVWHMVSSPVTGDDLTSFLTRNSNVPTNSSSLRGMKPYTDGVGWGNLYTSTPGGSIGVGKGYAARVATSGSAVVFNGIPSASNHTGIAVSNSGYRWNLLGNPYPSAIYLNDATNGFLRINNNALKIDGSHVAVYLWNPSTNVYDAVNLTGTTDYIPAGQGFFIKAASGATSVDFNKAMRVHQPSSAFKSSTVEWPNIKLIAKSNDITSPTKVVFNEGMTAGLDPGHDAGILKSGNGFDIYTKLVEDNGVDFMLQALPGRANESFRIPVGVDASKAGNVVLKAEKFNLPKGYRIILEDALLQTKTELTNGSEYTASVAENSSGTGRFYLLIGTSEALAKNELSKPGLQVYTAGKTLLVNGEVAEGTLLRIYSLDGRMLKQAYTTSNNRNQMELNGLGKGVYLLAAGIQAKPVKFTIAK